jgi:hypothetical protein
MAAAVGVRYMEGHGMTDRPITVGEVQSHAATLGAMASALLTGLANGKYGPEVAFSERMLGELGVVFPPASMAEKAMQIFLALNKWTAPRGPIVPDGRGGWVPATNSPYDPATGEFL